MELVQAFRRGLERRVWSLSDLDRIMDFSFYGEPTWAGNRVSEQTALQNTAVWACVRVISEDIAKLPLQVFRRLSNDARVVAPSHYLYPILHHQANPELTAIEFREIMTAHALTWGNAYAMIDWDGAQRVRGLYPLCPDKITPFRENSDSPVRYKYRMHSKDEILEAGDIFHLRGLGYDGIKGYSPISMERQAIGLARAHEEFGARLYSNGVRSSGVLASPNALSEKARENLRGSFDTKYAGLPNSHKFILLEEGLTYTPLTINPDDAQFLDSRRFQVEEICRIFRVMPVKIGYSDKAQTYASAEQFNLNHVIDTLMPWAVRWEQAIQMRLLYGSRTHYAEHNFDGLLRGDAAAKAAYYKAMIELGIWTPNDVLVKENMNPVPSGNVYRRPLNTAFVDADGKVMYTTAPSTEEDQTASSQPYVNGVAHA